MTTPSGLLCRMRNFLAWERQGVGRWADMADVEFGPNDMVKPFENEYGEPMIFLNSAEAHWLMGCFKSTERWRLPVEPSGLS